jgi:hypothetical protein
MWGDGDGGSAILDGGAAVRAQEVINILYYSSIMIK